MTPTAVPLQIRRTLVRIAVAVLAAAALAAATGAVLGRARFGATEADALKRVEQEVRDRFERTSQRLASIAGRVAGFPGLLSASGDESSVALLFQRLDETLRGEESGSAGITVYDASGDPVAWSGRVTDLPQERLEGAAALFVAPAALGPRLVHVRPVGETDRAGVRAGAIVVEEALADVSLSPGTGDRFTLDTPVVPVSLEMRVGAHGAASPYTFTIPSREGQVLVEADVDPEALAAARRRWRNTTIAAVLAVLAAGVLLCAGPILELRRLARSRPTVVRVTFALVGILAASRVLFALAAAQLGSSSIASWIDLLLSALLIAALVWVGVDLIERRRVAWPRPRLIAAEDPAFLVLLTAHLAAGGATGALMWAYNAFLGRLAAQTPLNLLHFSLHPFDPARLGLAFALVLLHAGVIWTAALITRAAATAWRTPRGAAHRGSAAAFWAIGLGAAVWAGYRMTGAASVLPVLVAALAAGACAAALGRARPTARRSSQAARLFALFLALAVPALALYPTLHAFASEGKERLVATEFAPQAARLRQDLQDSLQNARDAIDALPSLTAFITPSPEGGPTTDQAYQIWELTDLARRRLTSAVELYGPDGELVSRFALLLPDYTMTRQTVANCDWDLFEEVSPFGASERHVLRASRGICENGRSKGAIVVRAMLDYQTLPFISTRSPYLESLRPGRPPMPEDIPGRDVEFVVYGWSRSPIFVSGTEVWPLGDGVFQRMVESREPFWETVGRNGDTFRVYYFNDRGGIYALGYPVIDALGHLVNLAELVTLASVLFIGLLAGATLANAMTSRTPASGRALLREVRSSFYRKLFLAFVAVAVVPVVILALAARAYFFGQFQQEIRDAAVQTATVAQRLVEDYVTVAQSLADDYGALQPPGARAADLPDDQIMVLVGQAINHAVNFFSGDRLQATSERDLFASQLLPMRTPGTVYQEIVLNRLPTYVGEEVVGSVSYLVAAAPVRATGAEGIVTVPQTLRHHEIEQQIDELDRRILLGFVMFVLLGASLGYWMAERIADPVNRLTRATRRIARGDLDARIAATSSDELRRLVEDFNRMAADLKRQRRELERTQRLEAWAEMARQVAHDIKNPLTPIQLSAEHMRRVNADRGEPLSPVLEECVGAILTQVKLLRQISTEFSSFASSPTPRPEATDVGALVEEVIDPYRLGLGGRIAIDVRSAPDVPAAQVDRTLFARALTNIVENALHAMPGQGRLTITSTHSPGAVMVEIADTGVGMDPEALARIFEPYFSTKASGTGLGLTIAKRNVELLGGTLAVESERGAGTTVRITLPVERGAIVVSR